MMIKDYDYLRTLQFESEKQIARLVLITVASKTAFVIFCTLYLVKYVHQIEA